MTYEDFLENLEETNLSWHVNENNEIRTLTPSAHYACPLCIVANKILDKFEYHLDYRDAAEFLKMDRQTADRIAIAADNSLYQIKTRSGTCPHSKERIKEIRSDLLQTCDPVNQTITASK